MPEGGRRDAGKPMPERMKNTAGRLHLGGL